MTEGTSRTVQRIIDDVRRLEDTDGRLPLPDMSDWDIFPFEGEMLVKHLDDPVIPEPPRAGERGGSPCFQCGSRPESSVLLASERWRLIDPGPRGVPAVVLLETVEHVDLETLSAPLAGDLGVLTCRIERAMRAVDGVGRVHVYRFGDGSAHFHLWFFGRPAGLVQTRGSCLTVWDDVLPKRPADEWRQNLERLRAALVSDGGLNVSA
ncbi:MAG: hypothetical protein ACLQNG_02715 [Acidimicrobiales bacterium]